MNLMKHKENTLSLTLLHFFLTSTDQGRIYSPYMCLLDRLPLCWARPVSAEVPGAAQSKKAAYWLWPGSQDVLIMM